MQKVQGKSKERGERCKKKRVKRNKEENDAKKRKGTNKKQTLRSLGQQK